MTPEQEASLRTELMTAEINPTWSCYSTLGDMLSYFCDGEGKDGRWGSDVVMDRIIAIIKKHA